MRSRSIILAAIFLLLIFPKVYFAEVPEHNPDLDSNCPQGFQWSRGTVSCKQADCPSGAGRTYTYECNCGEAWDKPFRTCYDPKRPGLATSCVAAGAKCPGEEGSGQNGPGIIIKPPGPDSTNQKECEVDGACPSGYKCNLFNKCEPQNCNELLCALQRGSCQNDECVIVDKCANVSCSGVKCSGNTLESGPACNPYNGQCEFKEEKQCENGCTSFGTRCRIVVGRILFKDLDNSTKPLKFVTVDASWYDERGNLVANLPTTYSGTDGSVYFSESQLDQIENGTLAITISFKDQYNRIQVIDTTSAGLNPNQAQRMASPLAKANKSIQVKAGGNKYDLNLTFTNPGSDAKFARFYYHAIEAVEFMENELGLHQKSKPENIYMDVQGTNGAYHDAASGPGAVDRGVVYSSPTSAYNNPESPTNREWHEFSHHTMFEKYGFYYCCTPNNHAGYANPDSMDSYMEGFAEFMSMMMLDYYNYPNKNLYFVGSSPINMEMNYRVTSSIGTIPNEELALAMIYYDLLDGGEKDDDGVQLTRGQIWEVISSKHKFANGEHYIFSINDAYNAFKAQKTLPRLNDEWFKDAGVTKLDGIFIMHGVYADENHNGVWNPGEPIGYTLNGNKSRLGAAGPTQLDQLENGHFNRPAVLGSYIKLNVNDEETGQAIGDYLIHVKVHSEGNEEGKGVSYDYEFDTHPNPNGEINLNMPPKEDYKTTMAFSFGGDENYEQKTEQFTVTSDEFYQKLDPEVHTFATYSATLKPKPKPVELPPVDLKTILKNCPCASAFVLIVFLGVGCANYRKSEETRSNISDYAGIWNWMNKKETKKIENNIRKRRKISKRIKQLYVEQY
ncbi:hypothetical protein HY988_05850 [Candidatus Micrarchaeota archaeon]|nr:hypothetical protein [Candidatus Micrarchaeota archaeon]